MTDNARPERDTPLSPFAQEMRDRAEKALTTLTVTRAEVESNIAELRGRLESIGSEMAEAQLVIDALDGKLVRPDDTSRLEASEEARAEWPAPTVDQDILDRAREFARRRGVDGFTVADMLSATDTFPEFSRDEIDEDHGPLVDSLLTLLMGERLIHAVRVTGDETQTRYALVEQPPPPEPASTELESARKDEGGVQPESEEASAEPEQEATPTVERSGGYAQATDDSPGDDAPILPEVSGADQQKVIDDAVLEHLAQHPRSRREDIMSALTLTDIAAAQSLSRLVKAGEAKIVAENPSRWSLADTPAAERDAAKAEANGAAATDDRESRRGGTGYLSLEVVRDAAKRIGEPFNSVILAKWMTEHLDLGDVHGPSMNKYIRELHSSGILERSGGERGPSVRYTYVKPNGGGPTTRPRHDHPRQLPKGTGEAPERGAAVAHTGRAKGRSGKSSDNKKKQALGFRVKASRGDRKRAG